MTSHERFVVEYPVGGWVVERHEGRIRERVSDVFPTREAAVAYGTGLVCGLGGGTLHVRDRVGGHCEQLIVLPEPEPIGELSARWADR